MRRHRANCAKAGLDSSAVCSAESIKRLATWIVERTSCFARPRRVSALMSKSASGIDALVVRSWLVR
jgi:hypothetical protein